MKPISYLRAPLPSSLYGSPIFLQNSAAKRPHRWYYNSKTKQLNLLFHLRHAVWIPKLHCLSLSH